MNDLQSTLIAAYLVPDIQPRRITMPHPTIDETYQPRVWACKECLHVLGVVMRDADRIRRLWVFTRARIREDVPVVDVLQSAANGLYLVHGLNSGQVQCTHCGALNEWKVDDAFRKLMGHYRQSV